MSEDFKKVESLVNDLKEYVNIRVAQAKLSIAEKLSRILAYMVSILMAALVFFLFLVLVSIAAAIAIGQWLENIWLGFIIVACLCLLLGLLLWVAKDKLVRKPIMNAFIKVLFENDSDNEKD
jgi:ABC-type multidrug transport system permease subunit